MVLQLVDALPVNDGTTILSGCYLGQVKIPPLKDLCKLLDCSTAFQKKHAKNIE